MFNRNDVVTVYEDPFTRRRPEGRAEIIEHAETLERGVERYVVHFVGDAPKLYVVRTVVDEDVIVSLETGIITRATNIKPKSDRCCCLEFVGDNERCPMHGRGIPA